MKELLYLIREQKFFDAGVVITQELKPVCCGCRDRLTPTDIANDMIQCIKNGVSVQDLTEYGYRPMLERGVIEALCRSCCADSASADRYVDSLQESTL